jgi:hypothetical protein
MLRDMHEGLNKNVAPQSWEDLLWGVYQVNE